MFNSEKIFINIFFALVKCFL